MVSGSKFLMFAAGAVLAFGADKVAHSQYVPTEDDISNWKASELTNPDPIAASVGFLNASQDPYPGNGDFWQNVDIDYAESCYIHFLDSEKTSYELISSSTVPSDAGFGVFLTHEGPCGVCSSLQDLAVYMVTPDLTGPVSRCALQFLPGQAEECIAAIGFSDRCSAIWLFNAQNTRRLAGDGGCLLTCLFLAGQEPNDPSGFYNPCNPEAPLIALPEDRSFCKNTINSGPACSEFQFRSGEFRLNSCIQCDECRSGPVFQKLAGRTRRLSGIVTDIARPDVSSVDHDYYSTLE